DPPPPAAAAVPPLGAGIEPTAADALFLATTSSPYAEKQLAAVVATALDLPRTVAVADFGGSTRAGMAALRAAFDGVRAGSLARAIVVAAGAPPAAPRGQLGPR